MVLHAMLAIFLSTRLKLIEWMIRSTQRGRVGKCQQLAENSVQIFLSFSCLKKVGTHTQKHTRWRKKLKRWRVDQ